MFNKIKFHFSELVVKSLVAWREKSGDLGDAEEGVAVEDEGDEELTRSELRIVERCASGVGGFPVTRYGQTGEGVETVCTAVWTEAVLLDDIATPLDDGVERLGLKFYYTQFSKFC